MPRQARAYSDICTYHIMIRGNEKKKISKIMKKEGILLVFYLIN